MCKAGAFFIERKILCAELPVLSGYFLKFFKMLYLVTYDLRKSGQNYDGLIDAIKSYSCVHPMQSVWFIKTSASAKSINDKLKPYIDSNDSLFITEITNNKQGWLSQIYWDFINGQ